MKKELDYGLPHAIAVVFPHKAPSLKEHFYKVRNYCKTYEKLVLAASTNGVFQYTKYFKPSVFVVFKIGHKPGFGRAGHIYQLLVHHPAETFTSTVAWSYE